jgi:hypothetical protein
VPEIGEAFVKVTPTAETRVHDAYALAGSAGRLYQAIRAKTVKQMTTEELTAWAQFCTALKGVGILAEYGDYPDGMHEANAADALDPVAFVKEEDPDAEAR